MYRRRFSKPNTRSKTLDEIYPTYILVHLSNRKANFLNKKLSFENGAKRCKGVHCVDLGESFPGADRPGRHAAGAGGAASRKKEAKGAAPGRRQKAPSGNKGTQKTKKASVAPKEK